ncbi:hypothetical protein J7355_17270 [Endozoicomonas sp. G2_2]|uniref:hypothetical protein n=1 Tax=Endozoicomonas sp. G2_2 TaxID=2821092 RepID=UPI001AD9D7B6|nr:hypothetical protein [Endozoicomonas sp. G2_2]MBO9471845.1 hypothetical protein [Endozoicomonas sp. G2_2]
MRRADSQIAPHPALFDTAAWERQASGHPPAGARSTHGCAPKATPRGVGGAIMQALSSHPTFMAAALPQHVFPPLFNRYGVGHRFGAHIDNSIRQHRQSGARIRTDLSATLFFAGPEEYDGGELVIEDNFGT